MTDVASECQSPCYCGLPLSRNPHPSAGMPEALIEVGAVWVCIPCTVESRHRWSERALKAEAECEVLRPPEKSKLACVTCGKSEVTTIPKSLPDMIKQCETFTCKQCVKDFGPIDSAGGAA